LSILTAMIPQTTYSSWLEIDLGAIAHNTRRILEISGVQVMAVVKANGYGHGAIPVARAALKAGATWCGVGRIEEAIELRKNGIDCPILLMGFTPLDQFELAITNNVSLTVWSPEQVERASATAQKLGLTTKVHLKVDTGMGRLGIQPSEVVTFSETLINTPGINFEGIFTHFARAEELGATLTTNQEREFDQVLSALISTGISPTYMHSANSAAGLTRPGNRSNIVRVGIAIYGLNPSSQCHLPSDFRPALCWKSVLSQVKILPAGRGLSYGHAYITKKNERIGTIPVGYADGFRRTLNNQVIIGGCKVPIVGRVCMDQSLVQLDMVSSAKMGDEVVLIGNQGDARLPAEEIAGYWGTINYEVVCGIGSRIPRQYV
jgi:alanine racemase